MQISTEQSVAVSRGPRRYPTWFRWALAGTIVVALGLTGIAGFAYVKTRPAPDVESGEQYTLVVSDPEESYVGNRHTPPPRSVLSDAQVFDNYMVEQDFEVVESGETYMRWADLDEVECGYRACAAIFIYSASGCSSGFYVRADVMSGSLPIGWTNEVTASAQPDEIVVALLEDAHGGDSFRVTEIRCRGF